MSRIKCYVSHRISNNGTDGDESQQTNCEKAIEFCKQLRGIFPNIDFYLPAEHEDFVGRSYKKGILTIDQILDIDCEILQTCNFMLGYAPGYFWSQGMCIERDYAYKHSIPVITESHVGLTENTVLKIQMFLESLLR